MSRESTTTIDGLEVGYGTRNSANAEGGNVHTKGRTKQLEVNLDFRAMPTAQAVAVSTKNARIPAGSVVRSARLAVDEVFATTTSLDVGLKQLDGTAVGTASAIMNDASVAATGNVLANDLDVEVTADAYVAVLQNGGAATAGRGVLTIEYDENTPSSAEPAPIQGIVGTL